MTRKPFRYESAHITNVVDGDTFDAVVEITPSLRAFRRIRIRGIDAPEIRTRDQEEKRRGLFAKAMLEQLVKNLDCSLTLHGRDHYGRWVCDVENEHYTDIAAAMVHAGAAVRRRTLHERDEVTAQLWEYDQIELRPELDDIAGNNPPISDIPY